MEFYKYKGFNFIKGIQPQELLEERRADQIKVRPDDVFVASYPKSGTSWVIHALLTMYDNWGLLEVSDRSIPPLPDYFYSTMDTPGVHGEATGKFIASPNDMSSPRLFKTHLPPFLLPSDWQEKGCKVIYISRNPKDVCVSEYYFMRAVTTKAAERVGQLADQLLYPPWEDQVRQFANGEMLGPWLNHVVEWNKFGVGDNVFHVKYEDLQKDMKPVFKQMAEFLGRPLSGPQLDKVVAGCSLEEMKKHARKELDLDNHVLDFNKYDFFRKGKAGDWKDHFTVAQSEMFDAKIGKGLKEAGLDFIYEV